MTDKASTAPGNTANNITNSTNESGVREQVKVPKFESQETPPNPDTKVSPLVGKLKTRKPPKVLDLRLLDIRVGKVRDVEPVEGDEDVLMLKIDVKKQHNKTSTCSVLSATGFDVYDLIDKKVVTVLNGPVTFLEDDTECNIKVLAAVRMGGEDGSVVEAMELLKPPKKAKTGYPIYAEGYFQNQYWSIKEKNYKIIMKDLRVNEENQVAYRGIPLKVKGQDGYVTTKTLTDCSIVDI